MSDADDTSSGHSERPQPPGKPQPWVAKGDIDGFFGLAVDNLIQFLLILGLCKGVLGFSDELLLGKVLPGAAMSLLAGNAFYAWQSRKLSADTGRTDVCALPYGINTVSLFAYVFLVMLPVKLEALAQGQSPEAASTLAWQVGLCACFVSAAIELGGSFVAERIRRATPRAALLSTLAGIAISFIAIDFAIKTFAMPLVAMLPLGVILTTYFANMKKMPLRIPGGAWAVILGCAAAWVMYFVGDGSTPVDAAAIAPAADMISFHIPVPVVSDMIAGIRSPIAHQFIVPVMLPMGLFNVIGSLQNIESAEAAGDSYPAMPSLAVNGAGSMLAALFGSCFPTTIYIGHPGWKALGARSGYSILNGAFFTVVALGGLTSLIAAFVPIEAGMAIILWIGVVITAQAFQTVSRKHASAVAMGLFPAIAAWGVLIMTQTLGAAGMATEDMSLGAKVLSSPASFARAGMNLQGLVAISQGFILTCMVWAAMSTFLLDRRFNRAALWAAIGAVASFFGFIHAGRITPSGALYDIGFATGWRWAAGYTLVAAFLYAMHLFAPATPGEETT
jgi:AGZA family xanthine/uracil permease-like MFS transporter